MPDRSRWALDEDVVFLNHGSFGACPRAVLEHQREWRDRMEREPVRFLGREVLGLLDEARGELAPFLGAAPEDLAFVPNVTFAVSSVLRSLALDPEDELLVTDLGYNACTNATRFVAERSGARLVVAHVPFPIASPDEAVEAVLAAVGPRTRLALIDHVTSATGLVLPIERIVAELRERGVETLVDGAHAVGMLPLDLDALGAAYTTSNFHKWLCAPKGSAFLHVRRDRQRRLRPAVISHGANAESTDKSRFQLEFAWCGTVDPTPWLSTPFALRFLEGLLPGGMPALREHNRSLVLRGRDTLCAALGVEPPAPDAMIGSLASLPLPEDGWEPPASAFDVDPLQAPLLERHGIEVWIGTRPSAPRRILRLSAQAYNRPEEYELLARALVDLL